MVGVGLGFVEIGARGLKAGLGCHVIGFGGLEGGFIGVYIGGGLDIFKLGEQVTLLDAVAFLDVQLDDFAEGVGADIDVGLRLDFARGADHGAEGLLLGLGGLDGD